MTGNKRNIGNRYEEIAAGCLRSKGYEIKERNYRKRVGEIDIIAEKNGCLVAVEIKYRSSEKYGEPVSAVNFIKQKRICKTFYSYLYENKLSFDAKYRFDVIAVYGDERVVHIKNAFDFIA